MPAKFLLDIYLDKATLPQLIPPNRLNEIFLLKFPLEKRLKIEEQKVKPYTISYPRFFYNEKELITNFSIELSVLDEKLLEYFLEVLSMPSDKLLIGDIHIEKIKIKNLQEEDFEDFLQNNELITEIALDFITPTILEKNGIEYLLPDPVEIFIDATEKWNTFSRKKINFDNDWVLKHVKITAAFLRTFHVEMPTLPPKVGFTGKVFFKINTKSPLELNKILALKRFIEYSHLGKYTNLSFGKVITL